MIFSAGEVGGFCSISLSCEGGVVYYIIKLYNEEYKYNFKDYIKTYDATLKDDKVKYSYSRIVLGMITDSIKAYRSKYPKRKGLSIALDKLRKLITLKYDRTSRK